MAMNLKSGDDQEEMMDINTTPLIDVMLVLLVMLIITIPVQLHAVNLNLPQNNPPPPPTQPEIDEVDIDFDGTISWNGVVVPDKATLDAKFAAAALEAVQPEIHIIPNKLSSYATVIEVMASAERHGMTKIGIVGNEQYGAQ
jgi:biopolymer transport protein ExbD